MDSGTSQHTDHLFRWQSADSEGPNNRTVRCSGGRTYDRVRFREEVIRRRATRVLRLSNVHEGSSSSRRKLYLCVKKRNRWSCGYSDRRSPTSNFRRRPPLAPRNCQPYGIINSIPVCPIPWAQLRAIARPMLSPARFSVIWQEAWIWNTRKAQLDGRVT